MGKIMKNKIERSEKKWALVVAYGHPRHEKGKVISRHLTYRLAEKAAKNNTWHDFLKIVPIEEMEASK